MTTLHGLENNTDAKETLSTEAFRVIRSIVYISIDFSDEGGDRVTRRVGG